MDSDESEPARSMTGNDGRWVRPTEGADPRDIDRETSDATTMAVREATRQVTHDQDVERDQGLSSDQPGIDPSDRDREGAGQPTD